MYYIYIKYYNYKCSKCGSFYENISDICEKYCRHTNVSISNVIDSLEHSKVSIID